VYAMLRVMNKMIKTLVLSSVLLVASPLAAQERKTVEQVVKTCVQQVRTELGDYGAYSFDAYVSEGKIHWFGMPFEIFKFNKCLALNGVLPK
jgi:hypothetical protein